MSFIPHDLTKCVETAESSLKNKPFIILSLLRRGV